MIKNDYYTASNGVTITPDPHGFLGLQDYVRGISINKRELTALREYVMAERDEQLGRWRSKEHPDYVVYPQGPDVIEILHERDGRSHVCEKECLHTRWTLSYKWAKVKAEYFSAHPEKKPWHDAEHEEVWEITANGDTGPALATTSNKRGHALAFQFANGTLIEADSDEITAGRRIWPEGDDDE